MELCPMSYLCEDDVHAIRELRRMADLYRKHGHDSKAAELLELAGSIELRLNHEAGVMRITSFREQASELELLDGEA